MIYFLLGLIIGIGGSLTLDWIKKSKSEKKIDPEDLIKRFFLYLCLEEYNYLPKLKGCHYSGYKKISQDYIKVNYITPRDEIENIIIPIRDIKEFLEHDCRVFFGVGNIIKINYNDEK